MDVRGIDADVSKLLYAFLECLEPEARVVLSAEADLGEWLARCLNQARAAWPDFVVPVEVFMTHLAANVMASSAWRSIRTSDLYLACACSERDERALAVFERRYFSKVEPVLARMKVPASIVEDLKGALREKIFFGGAGARPLVADYSGRGELGAWVRSIAVHAALKALRRQGKDVEIDDAPEVVASGDPELSYLKSRYAAEFATALAEAMGDLSNRERNVLRQRYVDGLNIDNLGALYGVHRATAARWMGDACASLLSGVRKRLKQKLGLDESELDSVIRLGRSGLDMSLSKLFRDRTP